MLSTFRLFLLTILFVTLLILAGCEDDRFRGTDFSLVPDPVDITGIVPDTLPNGTLIFDVEIGDEDFGGIIERDQGRMYYSVWANSGNGQALESSYANANPNPIVVSLENRSPTFRQIVTGMNQGGVRAALLPPALHQRDDTLRYDIELIDILD